MPWGASQLFPSGGRPEGRVTFMEGELGPCERSSEHLTRRETAELRKPCHAESAKSRSPADLRQQKANSVLCSACVMRFEDPRLSGHGRLLSSTILAPSRKRSVVVSRAPKSASLSDPESSLSDNWTRWHERCWGSEATATAACTETKTCRNKAPWRVV